MKLKHVVAAMIVGSALMLSACGGGSSSSSVNLTGAWKGVYDDFLVTATRFWEMDVTVDGNTITDVTIANGTSGLSGSITKIQSKIYRFDLTSSGGTTGGFITDSSATHAGLLDVDSPAFAVLQKGATSLPQNYVQNDIAGSWSGYSVHLTGGTGDPDLVDASSATVICSGEGNPCTFTGTGPAGTFAGSFTAGNYNNIAGAYGGTYTTQTSSGPVSGSVVAYLSPDKSFAASWACDNGATPPSVDCSYNSWSK